MVELNYNIPITESVGFGNKFLIKGIAINETITGNNHKFLGEELKLASNSLKGVPLLVDHDNRVESIKGRVMEASYDSANKNIPFVANVVDPTMRQMIKDGLIDSVSVGAVVKDIEEEDGVLIPRGITFKELSLVAVPADAKATFTVALQEAYKANSVKATSVPVLTATSGFVQVSNSQPVQKEVLAEIAPSEISRNERGSNMEENKELESQKLIAELQEKVTKFEAKERTDLEAKYNVMCSEKKVKAMDVSKMDSETVKMLIEQLKSFELPKVIEAPKVAEKPLELESKKSYRIVQEGRSFYVDRY